MTLEEIIVQRAKADANLAHFFHHEEEAMSKHYWSGKGYAKMILDQENQDFWKQWGQWDMTYRITFLTEWERLESIHIVNKDTR